MIGRAHNMRVASVYFECLNPSSRVFCVWYRARGIAAERYAERGTEKCVSAVHGRSIKEQLMSSQVYCI